MEIRYYRMVANITQRQLKLQNIIIYFLHFPQKNYDI